MATASRDSTLIILDVFWLGCIDDAMGLHQPSTIFERAFLEASFIEPPQLLD